MMNDLFKDRNKDSAIPLKAKISASDIALYIDMLNQKRRILIREIDEIDSQLRLIVDSLEMNI